jgi:plasmid stabilization system protein ParE
MQLRWTEAARSDLTRLHAFLAPVNRKAAARIVHALVTAPERLRNHPRLGQTLPGYAPRELRRLLVGDYELRYEICQDTIIVLTLWHTREDR